MAKTKAPQTAAQKAADAARANYQKAKEAHDLKQTDGNKKALDTATDAMRTAVKAENRERFLSVGKRRVLKARAAIRQLVKVSNKKTYEYSDDEGQKLIAGVMEAVADVRKAFTTSTDKSASSDNFSF